MPDGTDRAADEGVGTAQAALAVASRLAEAYGRFRGRPAAPYATLALAFLGLAVLPDLLGVTVAGASLGTVLSVHILIIALVWATAAQSWNLISGFAGQFSLGHAAFFGLGAYVPIVLIREFAINPWIGMLAGGVVAGLYGLLVGGLCFRYRLRGHYFTLTTLAFAELLRHVLINTPALGAASGFVRPLPRVYAADYGLVAFQFRSNRPYYYVILGFLVLVSTVALVVKQSQLGLHLAAIRDDEDAAMSVGVPSTRYKLAALAASAFFTAWVGAFWAMYFTSIRPNVVYALLVNVDILLPVLVGGFGTVLGPIVGSLVLTSTSEVARHVVDVPGLENFVYGLLLLVIVLYSPGGVVSWPARSTDVLRRFGRRVAGAGEPPRATPATDAASPSTPTPMDAHLDPTRPVLRGDGDGSLPPDTAPVQRLTLEDTVRLDVPRAALRSVLADASRLEACLPGVAAMASDADRRYTCTVSQRIDGITHLDLDLDATFELIDAQDDGSVVIRGEAHDVTRATSLFVLGAVRIDPADDAGLEVSYTADVDIQSRNASVEPRVLGPTLRDSLERAFENLEAAADREVNGP